MHENPNRREVLKGAISAGLLARLRPDLVVANELPPVRQPHLIRQENERPGTRAWLLTNTRVDPKSKCRCPWIEGYCSHTSIRAGETLQIMVSTAPASRFTIDVYRLGYYQGHGGRLMRELGSFQGTPQKDPEPGDMHVLECDWEPAVAFSIPSDWPSGVYVGKLTAETDGVQSYVIFVVRDDRPCDFLFQCSDATWQAYNRWPDTHSLYRWPDGLEKPRKGRSYTGPGVKVSFDRPYGKYHQITDAPLCQGSGEFLLWEFPIAFWMEKEGYDVSYVGNLDTHVDGTDALRRAKAFFSNGHDEYWTRAMYDSVLGAVHRGMNAAFLSGDTCWGLLATSPSHRGVPNRVITRIGQFGPIEDRLAEQTPEVKRFEATAPTEADLIGARNTFPITGVADWICTAADHWLYKGTRMKKGDRIPNLIGWEWMGKPADKQGLRVVAGGPTFDGTYEGEYAATVYPGSKGNHVFNASTIWWGDGLSAPPGYVGPTFKMRGKPSRSPAGPDARVQRMMANLCNRFRDGAR